jgi:3-methyl-2-oxobutanoate hydroxymethyltransferase
MSDTFSPYANNEVSNVKSRIRIPHLQQMKVQGQKWAMLGRAFLLVDRKRGHQ